MPLTASSKVRTQVSQRAFKHVIQASTATTALARPAMTTTKPTGSGVLDTERAPFCRFIFGGTDGDGEIVNYQVIAWREISLGDGKQPVWVGEVIASGAATFGTLALSTLIEAANGLVADTITDTKNLTGRVLNSDEANGVATLLVPTFGATLLQVQTDINTAAKADVFAQLAEN